MMKLMLGTVQFGLSYGISNKAGKTSPIEVGKILDVALSNDINFFDTAYSYGDSEKVLGQFSDKLKDCKVTSKLPSSKISNESVSENVKISLANLKRDELYAIYFHNPEDLLSGDGENKFLELMKLKKDKLISKIGISAYCQTEIERVLSHYDIDIVQVPINLFDQRLLETGYLSKLKQKNIEIHARSIFLQGLFFLNENELPRHFHRVKDLLNKLKNETQNNRSRLLTVLLSFLKNISEIDRMVIGVNNKSQLLEIIDSYQDQIDFSYKDYKINDVEILNPSLWVS